ncbi:ribonuclease HII [Melioribacteraceae bacterium 4301-Me]|uniref:ribonuclease HII n=1 Tax=Pyranulibacter aquaticus TaxID=3163344 RepID=UPI0035990628
MRKNLTMLHDSLKAFDNSFITKKIKLIAGVDEAGRGPIAGPVVAAAVIFSKDTILEGVNDSKKLSAKQREFLFNKIIDSALSFGIGIVDHKEIDRINILQASLKSMKIAVEKLKLRPDLILIDGNKTFYSDVPTKTIIKGDSKSFAIAAASVIAKVIRDKLMDKASMYFPEYYWSSNKGYATKTHIEAVKKYGASEFHRKTFLKKIIEKDYKENPPLLNDLVKNNI